MLSTALDGQFADQVLTGYPARTSSRTKDHSPGTPCRRWGCRLPPGSSLPPVSVAGRALRVPSGWASGPPFPRPTTDGRAPVMGKRSGLRRGESSRPRTELLTRSCVQWRRAVRRAGHLDARSPSGPASRAAGQGASPAPWSAPTAVHRGVYPQLSGGTYPEPHRRRDGIRAGGRGRAELINAEAHELIEGPSGGPGLSSCCSTIGRVTAATSTAWVRCTTRSVKPSME